MTHGLIETGRVGEPHVCVRPVALRCVFVQELDNRLLLGGSQVRDDLRSYEKAAPSFVRKGLPWRSDTIARAHLCVPDLKQLQRRAVQALQNLWPHTGIRTLHTGIADRQGNRDAPQCRRSWSSRGAEPRRTSAPTRKSSALGLGSGDGWTQALTANAELHTHAPACQCRCRCRRTCRRASAAHRTCS